MKHISPEERLPVSRRTLLQTLGTLATVGTTGLNASIGAATAGQHGGGWTQGGFDAQNSNRNPNTTGPREGARARWRASLDRLGGPIVTDGQVFVQSGEKLVALDTETGNRSWSIEVGGTHQKTPAIMDGTVVVNTLDGIKGVAIDDGTIEWSRESSSDGEMVVTDDTIYTTDDGGVVALSSDGAVQSRIEQSPDSDTLPAFVDGRLYFDDRDNRRLIAIDAISGNELWTKETSGYSGGVSVSQDGETVFWNLGFDGVRAFDAGSGTERWKSDQGVGDVLAVGDTALYGTDGKINLESGERSHWRVGSWSPHDVVMTSDTMYESNAGEWVLGFDIEAQEILWRYSTIGGNTGRMAVANGVLFVPTDRGFLYALEPAPDTRKPQPSLSIKGDVVEHQTNDEPHDYGDVRIENGTQLTFDASESSDPDGTIERFSWHDNGVENGPQYTQTFSDLPPETNTFNSLRLTVVDDDNVTSGLEIGLERTVRARIELPSDPIRTGDTVDIGSNVQSSREVSEYRWDFGENGTVDTITDSGEVEWTFREPGAHTISLTVEDIEGATATVTEEVTVEGNPVPSPTITYDPPEPTVGVEVRFSATDSTIPDGVEISSYDWSIGDGNTTSGEEVTHTFAESGNYTVTLRLITANGDTYETQQTVSVEPSSVSQTSTETPVAPSTSTVTPSSTATSQLEELPMTVLAGVGGTTGLALLAGLLYRRRSDATSDSGEDTATTSTSSNDVHKRSACPSCGQSLDGSEKYCTGCAYNLMDQVCPECETDLAGDEKFCTGCGHDLSG